MLKLPDPKLFGLSAKLSPLEFKVYYLIKFHNIKNNTMLAKLLNTTPRTIAVTKNKLIKKGVLTREEALERIYEIKNPEAFKNRRRRNERKIEEKKVEKKKKSLPF